MNKASIDEIRHRFDNDVERFSSLESGQMTTQDAAIVLDHIANCARRTTPQATRLLDLGCGAGNFALKLSQTFTFEEIALVDLSTPMLIVPLSGFPLRRWRGWFRKRPTCGRRSCRLNTTIS